MLPGAPSQLPPAVLLPAVLALARPGELLGVWLRGCRSPCRLRTKGRSLLLGSDLGALLCRCVRVAVLLEHAVAVMKAERLIEWRTLHIDTGAAGHPGLAALQALYPDLGIRGSRIAVSIRRQPPEEVLSACAVIGLPVVSTRIEYRLTPRRRGP